MARFDYYQGDAGLLLDVQAEVLSDLPTRVVVPLLPLDSFPKPAKDLHPVFDIGDKRYVMVTHYLAAVPVGDLGARLGSLADYRFVMVDALDFLLSGF